MHTEGIEQLMDRRGGERVTFSEVADHLADYAGMFPSEAHVIDKLARFFAGVEDLEHDHDAVAGIGSDA